MAPFIFTKLLIWKPAWKGVQCYRRTLIDVDWLRVHLITRQSWHNS